MNGSIVIVSLNKVGEDGEWNEVKYCKDTAAFVAYDLRLQQRQKAGIKEGQVITWERFTNLSDLSVGDIASMSLADHIAMINNE